MKHISLAIGMLVTALGSVAKADIPAGYKGTPFDPALAGGTCNLTPPSPTAVAGPYPIPGRLLFANYDMGGLNVGFFTTDHDQFAGSCYRTDDGKNEASLSATSPVPDPKYSAPNGDIWYDTGDPTLDGTEYPNATTSDVYIGAVRPGDWVNITVNVLTAGTYQVSSTWASGNGPLGLEGGNGDVELQVSVNGTMMLDWKDVFPNYNTTANFHHWKPYPNMGTVTLEAGMQVIKLLSVDPHLNLDYIQFDLLGPDGGVISGGSGAAAGSGASSSGNSTSGSSASGTLAGASGGVSSGTSAGGGVATGGTGEASGSVTSGSNAGSGNPAGNSGGSSGTLTNAGTGVGAGTGNNGSAAGAGGGSSGSKGCALAAGQASNSRSSGYAWVLGVAALCLARARRSRR
jgi:hypothetical protein